MHGLEIALVESFQQLSVKVGDPSWGLLLPQEVDELEVLLVILSAMRMKQTYGERS